MMDGRDSVRYRAFSRRTALLSAGTAGLFALLTGRIFQLSVLQREQFTMMAEDNRINLQLLAPPRGRIFDRAGVELAKTAQNFRLLLIPERTKDVRAALERAAKLIDLPPHRIARALREAARSKPFNPVLVAEGLGWDDFAKINMNAPDLPGIETDAGELRSYPFGPWLSHVLGYVAGVTDKDIEKEPELLSLPGFRIGRSGVEKAADDALRGKPGASHNEVNAHGRVIREVARTQGTPGQDVVLSLDMEVQKLAQERLVGQSGSVVVMDVNSGELISIVSAPGFDPNAFTTTVTSALWKQLNEDPLKPLLNKAITGMYPPGSTYKPIVALAALQSGAMTPATRVHCSGATALGRFISLLEARRPRVHGHGGGDQKLMRLLFLRMRAAHGHRGNRCDVAQVRVGADLRSGNSRREKRLDARSGMEVRARKDAWRDGDTYNVGIGQGAVLTTPLQLCVMTARLANGGKAVFSARDQASYDGQERAIGEAEDLGLDPAHVAVVHRGMET